ncbi:MAG: hypothetical protein ACLQOO_09515 [Terriglobia bacterium]
MEGMVVEETGTEAIATAASPESDTEQKLTDEIRQLWAVHTDAQATVKKTKAEIKAIRQRLSERLFEMKQLLAKPGRNGGWSSFLRAEGIAKATADRLVRKHQRPVGQEPNVVTEQVSEPGVDVERLFNSLLPRLRTHLTSARSAYQFVLRLVGSFELACDMQADGILVFNPAVKTSTAAAAPAADGHADAAAGSGYVV